MIYLLNIRRENLPHGSFARITLGWTQGSEVPSLFDTDTRNLYCFLFSKPSTFTFSGSSAGISAMLTQPPKIL